jgi:membrane protease YdiL (CAAX protease family)
VRRGAALFVGGMIVFALCAQRDDLLAPRILGGVLATIGVAQVVAEARSLKRLFALRWGGARARGLLPVYLLAGAGLAVVYRLATDQPILPQHITWFLPVAIAIGMAEELAYRGLVWKCAAPRQAAAITNRRVLIASLLAAAAHAAYKSSLFLWPEGAMRTNIAWLAGATFAVGVLLGLSRHAHRSAFFAMGFHAAFDAIAYGDAGSVPWWA